MSTVINRRCPQCGRKAHDRLLVQCPDCRVPFVEQDASPSATVTELTPEQLDLLTRRILGSWKFWTVLIVLVGAAAWGVVFTANRIIEARSREYLNTFGQQATNQIGAAFGQISNQIALEFRQPKIKAAIEQVARSKAGDLFDNGVRPSVEAFQSALDLASAQLVRSSNLVAQLESDALAAQRRIPPPTPVVVAPALAPITPVTSAPVTAPSPATPATSAPATPTVKLALVNRSVIPAGNNYLLTLFFQTVNAPGSSSSGTVDIVAGTYKQTAKVLSFAPMTANTFAPPVMSDTGDAAELKFNVSDREPPTVVLELSGPTIVRIISDSLDNALTIPVAAEKMQLLPTGK